MLVEEQRKSTLCIYRKCIICPTQVTDTAEAKSERLPMRKCWNYSARPRIGAFNCACVDVYTQLRPKRALMLARRNNCSFTRAPRKY